MRMQRDIDAEEDLCGIAMDSSSPTACIYIYIIHGLDLWQSPCEYAYSLSWNDALFCSAGSRITYNINRELFFVNFVSVGALS